MAKVLEIDIVKISKGLLPEDVDIGIHLDI